MFHYRQPLCPCVTLSPMKHRFSVYGLFAALVGIFLWGLNARYPNIGEDYFYVFPRLLEGQWHFLRQGFAPLRFAPHLCGGFPQYGNPQDHFYSLTQLLSFSFDLWTALQLSAVIILLVGYFGWVRFGKDVLRLSLSWSHLLALVCLANGFYLMHMAVGQMWVLSWPLAGWLLWFAFSPGRETKKTLCVRAVLFSFLTAYVLYSGSQTLVLLMLLTVLGFLPFDLLLSKHPLERLKVLVRRFVAFGACALVLSASKLVAVYSLLSTLQVRAVFSGFHASENMVVFALKSFWALPQSVYLYASEATFSRVQEESMLTPHIALLGSVVLLYFTARNRSLSLWRKLGLALTSVLLVTFILLLVRGTGAVPEFLQKFPLFSALRVPERFLAVLSLLVSLSGIVGAAALSRALPWRFDERILTFVLGAVTLLIFAYAYATLLRDEPVSIRMPYDVVLQSKKQSGDFLRLPVQRAFQPVSERVSDFHYLFSASTGTECYEALSLNLPPLRNGPVDMVYDEAFNIYNPACLQYPEANNCSPRDRISVDDAQNFQRFIRGEKTTWKLSPLQVFADRVTLFGLVLFPLSLVYLFRRELLGAYAFLRGSS